MAIPVSYNLLSARERWISSVVAVLGIAGTVGVFVAMMALARGFKATLTTSGQPANALVQRVGADNEMTSAITAEELRVAEEAPQIAKDAKGPLLSPEVVVIAAVPMKDSPDGEANVQIRGVGPRVLAVREQVRSWRAAFSRRDSPRWSWDAARAAPTRGWISGAPCGSEPAAGRSWAYSTRAEARSIPRCGPTRRS
jgi:hypothetical protein